MSVHLPCHSRVNVLVDCEVAIKRDARVCEVVFVHESVFERGKDARTKVAGRKKAVVVDLRRLEKKRNHILYVRTTKVMSNCCKQVSKLKTVIYLTMSLCSFEYILTMTASDLESA